MSLHIVPISQAEANLYVERYHRHLGKVAGSVFQIACADADRICGVALCGRPVARHLDNGWTLEVNRCCTDGTRNANSMLYAACWRVAKNLGYTKLITYTWKTESGESLRGAGWKIVGETPGTPWSNKTRKRNDLHPHVEKYRWEIS